MNRGENGVEQTPCIVFIVLRAMDTLCIVRRLHEACLARAEMLFTLFVDMWSVLRITEENVASATRNERILDVFRDQS